MRKREEVNRCDLKSDVRSVYVPEIYRLIEGGADVQVICMQISNDFYSGSADRGEKLFLAIQELKSRALDGAAAMRFIARGSDELARLMSRIISTDNESELKKNLEIKGGEDVIELNAFEQMDPFRKFYDLALSRNILPTPVPSFEEFYEKYCCQCTVGLPPHLSRKIDKQVINLSSTFGVDEHNYLSQIGPKGILQARCKKNPQMLLLGSLGSYSAREFACFTRKLNPSSEPKVIEANQVTVNSHLNPYEGENGLEVTLGNALDMPFQDNSMDYLFTNFLIHYLIPPGKICQEPNKTNIGSLLRESYRVLKPGGQIILVERPYGEADMDRVISEIRSSALRVGFKVGEPTIKGPAILFRKDVIRPTDINSGIYINDNGFTDVGNTTLVSGVYYDFSLKLEKPVS